MIELEVVVQGTSANWRPAIAVVNKLLHKSSTAEYGDDNIIDNFFGLSAFLGCAEIDFPHSAFDREGGRTDDTSIVCCSAYGG